MRKVLVVVMMVLVMAAGAAWAEEDSHYQAADELLRLAHMDEVLSQTINEMLTLEIQGNPELALYEQVMRDFFAKYMSWDALKEDFIRIYMEEFTEGELRDMIAFYGTPTGQKAIQKTPVLAAKGARLGQQRVQDNIDELIEMLEAETQRLIEMQKKEQEPQEQQEQEAPEGQEEQGEQDSQ